MYDCVLKTSFGTSLQTSGKISPCSARGVGSILGRGAKIPLASWPKNQNIKKQQKQYCNKFSNHQKKNGLHQKRS